MADLSIFCYAIRNQEDNLRWLLHSKADPNIKTPKTKQTLLHYAAQHNNIACLKLLLKYDADIHARNDDGHTPLFSSVSMGAVSTARLLIEAKSNVNAVDNRGKSVLDCAAAFGNYYGEISWIEMLLDAGAKTTPQNQVHPKIVVSHRRLRRTKQALITFMGIMKKRLGVCKDMRTLMGALVYSTRYQEVWNMREIKRMK